MSVLRRLGVLAVSVGLCALGVGAAFAVADSTPAPSTGTNVACATATASVSTPGHTIEWDSTPVTTIAPVSTTGTGEHCVTQTYTIPTVTAGDTNTSTSTTSTSSTTPSQTAGCFSRLAACGFPDPAAPAGDPAHVGPDKPCDQLNPVTGPVTVTQANATVQGENITGQLIIQAPNVTVDGDCVTADEGSAANSYALIVRDSGSSATISNSVVQGKDDYGSSVQDAVLNYQTGQAQTATHDLFRNCGECISGNGWNVDHTFADSDGMQSTYTQASIQAGHANHAEVAYFDNWCNPAVQSCAPMLGDTFLGDTLLNPVPQTAVIFEDDAGGFDGNVPLVVKNSLLAGGLMPIWTLGGQKTNVVGTSTMDVESNRFATCDDTTGVQLSDGGWLCGKNTGDSDGPWTGWAGSNPISTDNAAVFPKTTAGEDVNGFFPLGGYEWWTNADFCPDPAVPGLSGQVWKGNVRDRDGAYVPCANPWGPQATAGHGANDSGA